MSKSLAARITFGILRMINFKKLVEKRAKGSQRRSNTFAPKRIKAKYQYKENKVKQRSVVTFSKDAPSAGKHIIYLHGGAYIFEASHGHWSLAEKMVNACRCRMTMIDYPLAPEKNYKDVYEMVGLSYDALAENYPDDEFILMGDSAGGGLAMGFCLKLIQDGHFKQVSKCILISPWLDLAMSNSQALDMVGRDYILTLDLLKYAADLYSDGDSPNQYLLSPINGDIDKMPPTLVLFASEELFKPDCLKLKNDTVVSGASFIFKEFFGLQHAWPVFPLPEQDQAVAEMAGFV